MLRPMVKLSISKKLLSKLDWNFPEFEKQLMLYRAAPRPDGFAPSELFLARKLRTNLPLPPGAYSLNVSRAVDAGNNRLSNFTHLQDKSGGQPLEEVPVGSDVAVYNYSQSMPHWASRGKVVATEQKCVKRQHQVCCSIVWWPNSAMAKALKNQRRCGPA